MVHDDLQRPPHRDAQSVLQMDNIVRLNPSAAGGQIRNDHKSKLFTLVVVICCCIGLPVNARIIIIIILIIESYTVNDTAAVSFVCLIRMDPITHACVMEKMGMK
jgi:hypothetical protein